MFGFFDKDDNLSETGHGIDKESTSYNFDKGSSYKDNLANDCNDLDNCHNVEHKSSKIDNSHYEDKLANDCISDKSKEPCNNIEHKGFAEDYTNKRTLNAKLNDSQNKILEDSLEASISDYVANIIKGTIGLIILILIITTFPVVVNSIISNVFDNNFHYQYEFSTNKQETQEINKDALLQTGINFIKNNENKIICIIQRDNRYEFYSNDNEWIALFDLSSSNLSSKDIKFYIKTEVYNKLKDLDFLSENWYKLDNNIEKGNIVWINKENIESIDVYSSHISFKLKNNKISPSCPISNLYLIDSEQITNDYRNQNDVDEALYEIVRKLFE